jgi:hypothetical protein
MMQFWTYFWRFRQCQLNFMPFASALHAAVALSSATLSALDIFAASAGIGTNATPLTSTVAIMPVIKAVAKRYMIPSLELLLFTPRPSHHIATEIDMIPVCRQSMSDSWLGNLRECLAHLV